jgi:acyl-coenzyme A synthetase/AMP-(fatty) acid ligase
MNRSSTQAGIPVQPGAEAPQPSAPMGVLPEFAAERHGATPFHSDIPWAGYDKPVATIGDFAEAVRDYADRLWAAGIRRDDTVAVVQRNHIEIHAVMCALGRIGALPALLSSAMESAELLECFARLRDPWVVADARGIARLADARHVVPAVTKRVLSLTGTELTDTDASWVHPALEPGTHQANPRGTDEWVVITHSSGTTGVPKLAAHSTRSLFGMVAPQIALCRQYGSEGLAAKHLSFVHVRTCSGVLSFLEVAMPMLAIADPEPEHVRRLLLAHRPASLETHPNVYIQWEHLAAEPERPFGSVERFVSTFDAMHPRTIRALLAGSDKPNAHYLQGYGQTESGPVTLRIVTAPEAAGYEGRNVGFPAGGSAVRVVDPAGEPVPPGEAGHIETLSPGRMRGYIGGQPMPADDQWWPMGDVGRLLPDGSLELLDRIVDHADDVESLLVMEDKLLDRFPELIEIVLVTSDAGGLDAVACPRPGARFEVSRLQETARELGLGGIPVHVWQWESLPLTGSYKVRRNQLRKRLANGLRTATPQVPGRGRDASSEPAPAEVGTP